MCKCLTLIKVVCVEREYSVYTTLTCAAGLCLSLLFCIVLDEGDLVVGELDTYKLSSEYIGSVRGALDEVDLPISAFQISGRESRFSVLGRT